MPCMVEICFPIRASICICVRSRLEDKKKRKKRLVCCIKQIRNKRWKTFSANLSCHRVWCLAFGAIWKIHLSAVSAKAAFQFCIFPLYLGFLKKNLSLNSDRLRQDLDSPKLAARAAAAGSIFQPLTKQWKHLWSNRRKIKKLKASCCGKRRWMWLKIWIWSGTVLSCRKKKAN